MFEALRAGASGFLLKDAPRADLSPPCGSSRRRRAARPAVTRRLIEAFVAAAEAARAAGQLDELTEREREVLRLVARGCTNPEIAGSLVVERGDRQDPRRPLLAKLGLRDRVQAVVLAYETGLIVPGDPAPS